MRSLIVVAVLVLGGGSVASGQTTGTLSGRVVSRESQAALEAARVEILGTPLSTVTGTGGTFSLAGIPTGVYAVRFSAVGYQPFSQANVTIGSGKPYTVFIELDRRALTLESIAVTATPYFQPTLQAPSLGHALNAEEVRNAPGVQEDVIRAIALLPGVGVTTGGRNDLVVRGGAPFENLFLVDGLEVPNLNHFGSQGSTGGPLSLINIDFVQDAEFSSGGFSARFGDRTASVTSVNLREANRDRVSGEVNLSATGVGAIVEAPLGGGGSVLASVRRSYLDFVFSLVGFPFVPTYWDATVKLVQPLGNRDRLSVLFIGALDDVGLDQTTADNRYDNSRLIATDQNQYIAGLTWQRSLARGYLEVTMGRTFSAYESSQVDSLEQPILSNRSREGNTTLRALWSRSIGERTELKLGQDLRALGDLDYEIAIPGEYRRDEQGRPQALAVDTAFSAWRWSPWAEGAFPFGDRLRATAGLRLDLYGDLPGEVRLSPRLLLAWDARPGTTVTLAGGRYHQAPASIWLVGDPDNPSQLEPFRSDQVVAGFERLLRPDLRLQIEGYYKWYRGYPARVWRPQAVLALAGFEDTQSDIPFGLEPLSSSGRGSAFGGEVLLQKRFSDVPLYGLASLSLNRTQFTSLDAINRPGSFDTRLITNLSAGYRLNPRWEVSSKFRLATGRPTTPFLTEGAAAGQLDFSQYNAGARLPLFHALDIRVDRRWAFRSVQLETYLDIQNVYGRENISQYQWDPRTGTVIPNESLGIFPTIGVNLEF
jgi:hypothetical protein